MMKSTENFSAEQSLELINETISNSRRIISARNGFYLIVWGIALTIFSLAVYFGWKSSGSPAWNFLWFAMPLLCYPLFRLIDRGEKEIPSNIISSLLSWTWGTFGVFAMSLSVMGILGVQMNVSFVIILLFGFAEAASGYILKNWPIIVTGYLTAIAGAFAATLLESAVEQMLIFTVAGVILMLSGVVVKFISR